MDCTEEEKAKIAGARGARHHFRFTAGSQYTVDPQCGQKLSDGTPLSDSRV
jgi:hypothetical protein